MAKILITGANGFIGSHTTLLMETLGHKVVPVDVWAALAGPLSARDKGVQSHHERHR